MSGSRSTPAKGQASTLAPRTALDALLAGSSGGTLRRAQWLDAVDRLLRPHLPPGMAAHARLANVRGDRLVFVVDAPVWHAKLRLAAPGLIDVARSIGLEVNDVGVKTTTAPLQPLPPATAQRPPMSATAQSGLAAAIAMLQSETADDADTERKAARKRRPQAPADPAEGAS
ncbi:DciA family protein [Thermomonas sp.]|uniref:DciA family protein n=1 Tax=Thermomonas sp. TaxID=1971895 RepID=UPI00391CC595